jgi:4'-phosphopantetheinyl transferase EntD
LERVVRGAERTTSPSKMNAAPGPTIGRTLSHDDRRLELRDVNMNDGSLRWVDSDTVLVVERIDGLEEALAAEELPLASDMQPRRLREFTAGRRVARRALAALGQARAVILIGSGGEPVWPPGIAGSLSHSTTHAAALVSRGLRHASVGIDLDDHRLIGEAAAADLMTEEEIEVVIAQGWAHDRALAQNVVFCAKEALFKCQYPLTHNRDLDFDDVRLVGSTDPGTVAVSCLIDDRHLGAQLAGIRLFIIQIQGVHLILAFASTAVRAGYV